MLLGIGVDVASIGRIQAHIARRGHDKLAKRILTSRERDDLAELTSDAARLSFLAARWTAKEAAYKACYPRHKLTWKDVSLVKVDKKPTLLHALADVKMHTSLSHDGDYVIAFVVAEKA